MRHLDPTLLIAEAERLERLAAGTQEPLEAALLRWRANSVRTTAMEVRRKQEEL